MARLAPVVLDANVQHHFYRGGPGIARFRGIRLRDDHAPEDWVGSCTCMLGTTDRGLSRLPDGRLLRDAVRAEPERYLGARHASAFGADPGVLVKLLDAGERLPVHWHPTRAFARERLGLRNGKTEAWVILETVGDARVFLGWLEGVDVRAAGRVGARARGWDAPDRPSGSRAAGRAASRGCGSSPRCSACRCGRTRVGAGAAFGAALLGGVAPGAFGSVEEAASVVVLTETIDPEPSWIEPYETAYGWFVELYPALYRRTAGAELRR